MLKEENVYKGIPQTENGVDAVECAVQTENTGAKEDSAVLGKFKDVDALARAYSSLQSEFTRRSQRLKELEKTLENLEEKDVGSGAEKLRKNAATRRDRVKEFDAFLAGMCKGGESIAQEENSTENAEEASINTDIPPSFDEKPNEMDTPKNEPIEAKPAGNNAKTDRTRPIEAECVVGEVNSNARSFGDASEGKGGFQPVAKNAEETSETLYERVSQDEQVRLRIIGEYLSSLGRAAAPVMAGGVGSLATPPLKAKSIGDAGDMALRYFKKTPV